MESALIDLYKRQPLTITKGLGARLWDQEGREYLDLSSGLGVNVLGHQHPAYIESIKQQLAFPLHVSNAFYIPQQEALAARLTKLTGLDKAFICNSGAEANEAALKLARLHAKKKNISNPCVVVMESAFHGRTLSTLSASGSRNVQAGFEPLVPGYIRAKLNDSEGLRQIANEYPDIVAICLEPIQGYGGIHSATDDFLKTIRELCDQNDWLMIADEIQCGHGRTGKYLSLQHADILPDAVTLAKGLGGGIPIGACLIKARFADYFSQGSHGSTFGGNPFACHAANTTLDILNRESLIERAGLNGDLIMANLRDQLANHPNVRDIRGKGSMIGIELDIDAMSVKTRALEQGLMIDVTASQIIRLLPPYILDDEDVHQACDILCSALT